MKQILLIALLALLPAVAQWNLQPPSSWRTRGPNSANDGELVTAAALRTWSNFMWVDARTQAEFADGHMPEAVLLNEDNWDSLLPDFLSRWQPGRTVVVYCGSGCESSRRIALRLRLAGVPDVRVLDGGWDAAQSLRP